jgi:hypothetical protein
MAASAPIPALAPSLPKESWPELRGYVLEDAVDKICEDRQDITDVCELLKGAEMSSLECTHVSDAPGSPVRVIITYEVDGQGGRYVADDPVPYIG